MLVITLLLLIGAAIAAPSANAPRIVGGTDADIRDYPHMAVIVINNSYDGGVDMMMMCGGSLITPRSVLTAAHCYVETVEMWRWFVRLGSTFWRLGGRLHSVESIVVHPGYRFPHLYNDVAMMKLATPAILSDRIALARIAGPSYVIPDNTTVTTIGWGNLEYKSHPSEILQQIDVLTVNHDFCKENYAELKASSPFQHFFPDVTLEMRCAGTLGVRGKDVCAGDSGGPLLHQGVVIGITSWGCGFDCGHPLYPTVYVNVPSYTSWIVDNA